MQYRILQQVMSLYITTGDVIDVSLNPSLMAPEIVAGTTDDGGMHGNYSHDQADHTLRTEMTRSRQYSRIILKRREKPLDRGFLKKSIRYTGFYQQRADKESSDSESEDNKINNSPVVDEVPPVVEPSSSKVISSHDNVMGLIQSVESLSNFFDIPAESSNGSHELQSVSCEQPSQQAVTSEVSSGYESMESSPTVPSTPVDNTAHKDSSNLVKTPSTRGSRIKARKRTKPIPRPRQHRPVGAGARVQQNGTQIVDGGTVTTTFNPQQMITCAAGIGCFGNDGGILTADNSKVTVAIPEGAIALDANPYIIQFEVCTDYRPSVSPIHAISPIVHVKSSNTTFTHLVTITIPHYIDDVDPSSCYVLATKDDLTTQSSVEFTTFPVAKAAETVTKTSDITCRLKGHTVSISTLSLQGYQWFMLTVNDEAIARQCRVLVFHSRPKHGNFIVKVTIVEDFTDAVQVSYDKLYFNGWYGN